MNFIKVKAKSNYIDLSLFVKEADSYNILQLIREIHCYTKPGALDYSPYRGSYQKPANDLCVTIRRVRIANNKARIKLGVRYNYTGQRIAEICANSFDKVNYFLSQYKKAA